MSGDRTDDEVGPHQGQGITTAGADLADAPAAVVLAHGRGASARGILGMADEFAVEGVAYLAPQAARNEWYPNSFLAPVEANEPGRSSGLRALDDAVGRAVEAGIPHERIVLGGFSQGACLAAEYVARNPRRYGGVIAFSGGLIGEELDGTYPGDLAGTPVFLGLSARRSRPSNCRQMAPGRPARCPVGNRPERAASWQSAGAQRQLLYATGSHTFP